MSEEKLTILTVDDEEIIRNLLHSFIIKKGHNSIIASTGKEAIQFANKEKPDIVLLDIKMPEMDGHQVCQRLRDLPSLSKTMGIIMITGYGSLDNKEKAVESGADDLIEKPLDLYELMYRINIWEEVRRIEDQLKRVAIYALKIRQYSQFRVSEMREK
jgi:DNA-binding response OmpR family regulator